MFSLRISNLRHQACRQFIFRLGLPTKCGKLFKNPNTQSEYMTEPQQLVQKLWNYCNILRDDGLSYGDYVEQLTFLLFLKMADEQSHVQIAVQQDIHRPQSLLLAHPAF